MNLKNICFTCSSAAHYDKKKLNIIIEFFIFSRWMVKCSLSKPQVSFESNTKFKFLYPRALPIKQI